MNISYIWKLGGVASLGRLVPSFCYLKDLYLDFVDSIYYYFFFIHGFLGPKGGLESIGDLAHEFFHKDISNHLLPSCFEFSKSFLIFLFHY